MGMGGALGGMTRGEGDAVVGREGFGGLALKGGGDLGSEVGGRSQGAEFGAAGRPDSKQRLPSLGRFC